MSWILSLVAKIFTGMFKDWRRDQELKQAGKVEQRLDNMIAAAKSRTETDETFKKLETGEEDLRGDL
jgi:hypothetical protein